MGSSQDLADRVRRFASHPGVTPTAVERLSLIRADAPSMPTPAVYGASLCLIAQGRKRVSLGQESLIYDASKFLLVSVGLPLVGHVLEASPERPYLSCQLDIDRTALVELTLAEPGPPPDADKPPLAVYGNEPDLVDALFRLVGLLERPSSIATLAPLIEREILYRLLTGPHGSTLRRIATGQGRLAQISRAIEWIRLNFRDQLRVAEVAERAGMSVSTLHEHFKAMTRCTPLEFQKQLRLHEARRLVVVEGATAGTAGFAVGYDSPSQFSREYRRLFGAPPRRDVEQFLADEGISSSRSES